MAIRPHRHRSAWLNELDDVIRGACGGFLFGIPLIYTMEVWWIGSTVTPPRLLAVLATMIVVIFLLNRTEGFRKIDSNRFPDAMFDTLESIAIGLVCTALMLILLREIQFGEHFRESLGKLIFESVPFALGVALANQFLNADTHSDGKPDQDSPRTSHRGPGYRRFYDTINDLGATTIGAIFIAFNIAPTDEIPMLAAAVTGPWLLATIGASLLISYGVVFQARFGDQKKRRQQRGLFQHPFAETIMAYLVSLIAAVAMLWFFQRLGPSDPWSMWLHHTLLLGLPASIGGAAGRLAT